MSNYVILPASFLIGGALGVFFFGGLWWTVLKGVHSKHPGMVFSLSMILRTGVTLLGFAVISQGHLERLAACLMGFFTARAMVMRKTRQSLNKEASGERRTSCGTEP